MLESIASAWNRAGIDYAVMSGLQDYPYSLGRDLDVLVDGKDHERAKLTATTCLRSAGFRTVVPPNPWLAEWLFAFRDDCCIEIDFVRRLFWGPATLVQSPCSTTLVGPFKVDPWAAFAKRVLMCVLGGSAPKDAAIAKEDEVLIGAYLRRLFGRGPSRVLLEALGAGDLVRLTRLGRILRRALILRTALLRPWEALGQSIPWLVKQVSPYFVGCAPIVALVGPDGVGKTTTLWHVSATLPSVFLGAATRHWRPGLLPPLARVGKIVGLEPAVQTSTAPRRTPGRLQWLRLIYYWLDYVIGHFLKDLYDSSRLRVVLYDRCSLDVMVDPLRYGLSSVRFARLLGRLTPRPDLIILLYDDSARIHARKPELPKDEIERQLDLWMQLAARGEVDTSISVDAPPSVVARRVRDLIIDVFVGVGAGRA